MIFNVYIYEGDMKDKSLTESLKKEALLLYIAEQNQNTAGFDAEEPGDLEIVTDEKGKPMLEGNSFGDLPVFFNVSHSGELWVMIVGQEPCGIDLQVTTGTVYKSITKKYFSGNEQKYVDKYGMEGFFRVWTHREAYGKFTGKGVLSEMPEFVDDEGMLNIRVEKDGLPTGFVKDIPVAGDVFMCYCTGREEDDIEFRM